MLRSALIAFLAVAAVPQSHVFAQVTPAPGGWRGTPVGPPPPPRVERVRPRRGFFWVDGRYDWRDGRYVWLGGRWERVRPGQHWHPGRWDHHGDRYLWIDGSWEDGAAYTPAASYVVAQPAPIPPAPPQAAPPPPQPRPGYVWIPGAQAWR